MSIIYLESEENGSAEYRCLGRAPKLSSLIINLLLTKQFPEFSVLSE